MSKTQAPDPAERKAAEQAYATTAFNYPEAPIGSRDWCLFWDGWRIRASMGAIPAPEGALRTALERIAGFTLSQFMGPHDMALECGNVARAALAAPAPQAPAWQPIETAPKDGSAVLVADGRFIYCVEWNEEFEWWAVDDNKLGPFRLRGPAPTHWMPLPAAPQTKEPTNDR